MKLNKYTTTIALAALMAITSGLVPAQDADLHVSKAATSKVPPTYPTTARQLGLQGDVEVEAHITEAGVVESAKPLTGNPVLAAAAVKALKEWKFTPFTNDGKAVKAIAPISFSFKL